MHCVGHNAAVCENPSNTSEIYWGGGGWSEVVYNNNNVYFVKNNWAFQMVECYGCVLWDRN